MSLKTGINKSIIENSTIYILGENVNFKNSLEKNLGKYIDDVDQDTANRVLAAYKDYLTHSQYDDNEYDIDLTEGNYLNLTDFSLDGKEFIIVLNDRDETPVNKVFELKDIK